MAGGMCGGEHAWQRACVVGVCMAGGMHGGGHVWQRGAYMAGGGMCGRYYEICGTHPTGMHSCSKKVREF